jgi:hypothetical protein
LPRLPRCTLRGNLPLLLRNRQSGHFVSRNAHHSVPRRSSIAMRPQRRTTFFETTKYKFQMSSAGRKMLTPPGGSQPPLRWARGPLSVPYRSGTPTYKLKVRIRGGSSIHAPSQVLQLWIPAPQVRGLRYNHVPGSSGPPPLGFGGLRSHRMSHSSEPSK